ncbi:MAG TPA: hypothetical protein VKB38_00455 [Terracidiphilus sp.]|nr:hypothetical protein [Terracidiphilus sp.]
MYGTLPSPPYSHIRVSLLSNRPVQLQTPLERALDDRLHQSAFVIHNDDPKEVVGIAVIWRITDAEGKSHTTTQMMDEFLSKNRNIVINPGGSLAVSPGGWLPEDPEAHLINSDLVAQQQNRVAERIKSAASVSASVDSVIYSNGEVWGPNISGLDKEITGRHAAAVHLASVIRNALANGEDAQLILKQLSSTKYDPTSDYKAKWESRFAIQLLARGPQFDAGVRYLEALPVPPLFERKSNW